LGCFFVFRRFGSKSIYRILIQALIYFKKALKENPKNESAKFFIVLTKASYYKDLQSKIELFENYIEKNPESNYITQAKWELKKLTKERFLKVEEQKN